ncbi:Flp family type IVb pilin [Ciceribacter thiooxidans]|uniref:Flp family type IVb pilin n=1 Tax=Ciceribacter thiooxidans TaxID=1969821 RepID=A0ABV7HUD1_9HYPH|nr:Flp family type IVb pilin [Ciceribacter thiooxidans]
MRLLRNLVADNTGATAVEYGLIAAIISVALLTGYGAFTGALMNVFETITTTINAAGT